MVKKTALAGSDRIYSIDTFRLVSIFFVILHHIEAFKYSYTIYPSNLILKFLHYFAENVRFLPFFFIAAGYFFGKGVLRGEHIQDRLLKYCKRLARLFFLWSFIYAFFAVPKGSPLHGQYHLSQAFPAFVANIIEVTQHPFVFLMRGTVENFWFFPALIIGLTIVVVLHTLGREKYIIPLGFVLYVIALSGKSYSVLPWGYQVDFEMRQGPFISTLFVGVGWMLAKKNNYHLKTAVLLIFTGIIMQILEALFLYFQYDVKPKHEYLLGTILFCIGIFVFTLARPNIGKNTIFPQLGGLTLGVYAIHMLLLKPVGIFRPYLHPIAYDVLRPIAVYLLSILITLLLKRNSFTKVLVT